MQVKQYLQVKQPLSKKETLYTRTQQAYAPGGAGPVPNIIIKGFLSPNADDAPVRSILNCKVVCLLHSFTIVFAFVAPLTSAIRSPTRSSCPGWELFHSAAKPPLTAS